MNLGPAMIQLRLAYADQDYARALTRIAELEGQLKKKKLSIRSYAGWNTKRKKKS